MRLILNGMRILLRQKLTALLTGFIRSSQGSKYFQPFLLEMICCSIRSDLMQMVNQSKIYILKVSVHKVHSMNSQLMTHQKTECAPYVLQISLQQAGRVLSVKQRLLIQVQMMK